MMRRGRVFKKYLKTSFQNFGKFVGQPQYTDRKKYSFADSDQRDSSVETKWFLAIHFYDITFWQTTWKKVEEVDKCVVSKNEKDNQQKSFKNHPSYAIYAT